MEDLKKCMDQLKLLKTTSLFEKDFLLTWEKSKEELEQILLMAKCLRKMRDMNISGRIFDSGLAVSIFRDNSTRTRFSFASAANFLGLEVQDMDESKSQIAHGETVRETANMISFLSDFIGIRDDIYPGMGHEYMKEVGEALDEGYREKVLPDRPGIINLQCDRDHPTQSLADLLHLEDYFGGLDKLKGKKLAMSWAYSPSYGKPMSVPQGIIALMTRFGLDVTLAHPPGYELMPDIVEEAKRGAAQYGGKLQLVDSMEEAFDNADIVYPKSWAPMHIMQKRTELHALGDEQGLLSLEEEGLAFNGRFKDWECNEAKMKLTKGGKALYMHCLPADITGVSCQHGEVSAGVFEKYRLDSYREASWKPWVIAAMMLGQKSRDPVQTLTKLMNASHPRVIF